MQYEERFGLVDWGTPGVHGGAVVRDVAADIEAMRRMGDYDVSYAPGTARIAYQPLLDRQEAWHARQRVMYEGYWASRVASGEISKARRCAFLALAHKLAAMTPHFGALRQSDAKHNVRAADDAAASQRALEAHHGA